MHFQIQDTMLCGVTFFRFVSTLSENKQSIPKKKATKCGTQSHVSHEACGKVSHNIADSSCFECRRGVRNDICTSVLFSTSTSFDFTTDFGSQLAHTLLK